MVILKILPWMPARLVNKSRRDAERKPPDVPLNYTRPKVVAEINIAGASLPMLHLQDSAQ
jgi:hypothetical protein